MENGNIEIQKGSKFGFLTVLETGKKTKDGKKGVLCKCSCGKTLVVQIARLLKGRIVSCGHYREQKLNIGKRETRDIAEGEVFEGLTVIKSNLHYKSGRACLCRCKCGKELMVRNTDLLNRRLISCGCKKEEGHCKHGLCKTRLYQVYEGMKRRCYDEKCKSYVNYGARGISICEEWNTVAKFAEWAFSHGYSENLTIDRIDNNKGYCPDNCRWATILQQARNKRNTRMVEFNGKTVALREVAETIGIPFKRLSSRMYSGKTGDDLFYKGKLKTGKKVKNGIC